ncbi:MULTISPECIES: helix-turn-helix domain-containing protein [unclassified Haladaptatus]|uniref:helix-turn-helix domain-containing protein n=1 Tax=unclassified Haladaptatus TaxID=2622732 RepID=UPI00209C54E2|nr:MULTISPECIES: helix-turn-helix domain-containing protein [unclassified Haladaptatus]MCO8244968.1 helix-turn-helix domain-containing protein [Haladaptatus sp. AB643]MCO8253110.1 helix-turn-helix domain-containing protein [Haladaptatus sp. AB618]
MTVPENPDEALRVSIDLWYPDCWEIQITDRFDVGFLGYGIYATGDEVSTLFTIYADERETITDALEAISGMDQIHSISEMAPMFQRTTVQRPGNAIRELLVVHDGRKQISQPLTSRGFVCSGPIDIRDGREYWTLVTNHDRRTVQVKFDEVREEMDAEIDIRGMKQASRQTTVNSLPVDRLTKRQLEVFQLARERGYYDYPRKASAGELADELDISTSTLHEHLHKVEAILLGQNNAT